MSENGTLSWSNIDKRTRTMIMAGLAMGMLISSLDSTIVTTCATAISESLDGTQYYSWIFTAYMLCETIMIPIAGKLSDKYGRKRLFIIGVALFLIGSMLSGLSQNIFQFITFRGIQGAAGGIIVPVAMATVADLYPPEGRGKIQGMLNAIFALAIAIGPTVGGFIAEAVSWHWIFYINIPIGIVTLVLTAKKFPIQSDSNLKKIDYTGMAVLGMFLIDILMLFTWGGSEFPWVSMDTAVMVIIAFALLFVFVTIERRAEDPVLAPHLFRNKVFVWCSIAMMIFYIGLMGVMAYMPPFMQVVLGYSEMQTGMITVSLVAGMMITSMVSGWFVARTGYRLWLFCGPIISAAGMLLLSTMSASTSLDALLLYLFISGFGMGCMMSVTVVAVQNNSREGELGMTTSGVSLFRAIGGTVATGLFASLINSKLNFDLSEVLPPAIYDALPHDIGILDYLSGLPEPIQALIITAFSDSVTFAFMIGAAIVLFVIIAAFFIKDNKRNQTGKGSQTDQRNDPTD